MLHIFDSWTYLSLCIFCSTSSGHWGNIGSLASFLPPRRVNAHCGPERDVYFKPRAGSGRSQIGKTRLRELATTRRRACVLFKGDNMSAGKPATQLLTTSPSHLGRRVLSRDDVKTARVPKHSCPSPPKQFGHHADKPLPLNGFHYSGVPGQHSVCVSPK